MDQNNPKFIVVLGVSGSGKTTIGGELAKRLEFHFCDADDYHPKANKQKMGAGIPLTDSDRLPWLQTLAQLPKKHSKLVLACSALKEHYRSILVGNVVAGSFRYVFLDVPTDELKQRLVSRQGHYMKVDMLESQLATLERPRDDQPEYVIVGCAGKDVSDVVDVIVQRLQL